MNRKKGNTVKQAAWLFSILIALACSGWYFASSSPITKLDAKALSQTADTIVSHFTLYRFDKNGQLSESLTTPEIQHIPHNNTHLLQSPFITIAQENQAAWEISAKQAKSIEGGEKITFTNDVVIHQSKGKHNQESTLTTEELIYFPKNKRAISNKTIHFKQPNSTVHAQGIDAYLVSKHIKLIHARAYYDPKHG